MRFTMKLWSPGPGLELSADTRVLHVSARHLGRCTILHSFSEIVGEVKMQVLNLLDLVKDEKQLSIRAGWYKTMTLAGQKSLDIRLTRAFSAHALRLYAAAVSVSQFEEDLAGISTDAEALEGHASDMHNAVLGLCGKTLFVTSLGLLGIGAGVVWDGDEVILSNDFVHPVVIRRRTEKDSLVAEKKEKGGDGKRDEDGSHRMLGFAYVDGLMSNDCELDELVKEALRKDVETFYIS
jgi:hypothetical protein